MKQIYKILGKPRSPEIMVNEESGCWWLSTSGSEKLGLGVLVLFNR